MQTGWAVVPYFNIGLHKKDIAVLEGIKKNFFGVGKTFKQGSQAIQLKVQSLK